MLDITHSNVVANGIRLHKVPAVFVAGDIDIVVAANSETSQFMLDFLADVTSDGTTGR